MSACPYPVYLPSGDTTGATDTAQINALLSSDGGVQLAAGTYYLNEYASKAAIVLHSGNRVCGAGAATILRPAATGAYEFAIFRNYRGTQTSGAVDSDIEVGNLTIDMLSTGITLDNRIGNAIGIYGADRVSIHDIFGRNIPFSLIEISENYAGQIINGVSNTSPPISTSRVTVRNIIGEHIGWQNPVASGNGLNWQDGSFGVIVRSGANGVEIENAHIKDVWGNGVGVGQMDSLNTSSQTFPNYAQAYDVRVSNCEVDQTAASGTPGAPSFRFAYCFRVTAANCLAVGNSASDGFYVRTSGTSPNGTFTTAVALENCIAYGNNRGFEVSNKDASAWPYRVTLANCGADSSTLQGFSLYGQFVSLTGCHARLNGSYGFRLEPAVGATTPWAAHYSLVGCEAIDNGSYGVLVDNVLYCTVSGCIIRDTGAGAQLWGIREINSADKNAYVGNVVCGHPNGQIVTLGTHSIAASNMLTN